MTLALCPECQLADKVTPHCRNCGVLRCSRCSTLWTRDGHFVYNPARSG